jgi:hypothetical protein
VSAVDRLDAAVEALALVLLGPAGGMVVLRIAGAR